MFLLQNVSRVILPLILVFSLVGCKKDEGNNQSTNGGNGGNGGNNTDTYFMNATINGVNYSFTSESIYGFGSQGGCLPVSYFLRNIGQIDVSNFFLDVNLFHYSNNADFSLSDTGYFAVHSIDDYSWVEGSPDFCAQDLVVNLEDNSNSDNNWFLVPGGIHVVTSISQSSQSSTDVVYNVEGNFSMSFVSNNGQSVPVSGNYRVQVEARI